MIFTSLFWCVLSKLSQIVFRTLQIVICAHNKTGKRKSHFLPSHFYREDKLISWLKSLEAKNLNFFFPVLVYSETNLFIREENICEVAISTFLTINSFLFFFHLPFFSHFPFFLIFSLFSSLHLDFLFPVLDVFVFFPPPPEGGGT